MSFEIHAKSIIKDAIRSAVCIDDKFAEPYEEPRRGIDQETPKALRASFQNGLCSLEIHRFQTLKKYKKLKDHLLNDRDLMILDWELSRRTILPYTHSLEILTDAIKNPSLPFVIIYTSSQDLDFIELEIRSFLTGGKTDERNARFQKLLSEFDNCFFYEEGFEDAEPDDAESFFEDISLSLKTFVLKGYSKLNLKELKKNISLVIGDPKLGSNCFKILCKCIEKVYTEKALFHCFEEISFLQNNCSSNKKQSGIVNSPIIDGVNAIYSGNTFIFLLSKAVQGASNSNKIVSPDAIFERLSQLIFKRPSSIITMVSLEFKNRFRAKINEIGKRLHEIDELAFFHNQKYLPKDEFYDFIRLMWMNQAAAFYQDSEVTVFESLEEYKQINEIDKQLKTMDSIALFNYLGKLNYLFSIQQHSRKLPDRIRFGDIFKFKSPSGADDSSRWFLCITAHCDCLRPESKINFNYFMVEGSEEAELKTALKSVDKDHVFHSFIQDDDKILAIKWEIKPFSIFVPNGENLNKAPFKVSLGGNSIALTYHSTLIENFCQQIANASFASAARVGIDLAKTR